MKTTLYIVATPIGNLGDISSRALETLKTVDVILAEDTRVTKKLSSHFGIHTPLKRFDAHSDTTKTLKTIKDKTVALVSDAGTPGISDPGGKLVDAIWNSGGTVIPIPGASAVTTALQASGFPTDKYCFFGFIPQKKGRTKFIKHATSQPITTVFFESTHRIEKLLNELSEQLDPKRQIVVARELTKLHETFYRGTIKEVKEAMTEKRGEFTIVISS